MIEQLPGHMQKAQPQFIPSMYIKKLTQNRSQTRRKTENHLCNKWYISEKDKSCQTEQ